MKKDYDFYTYHNNRKCKYSKCQAPLADQLSASREYCIREELPDGSIKNCKDDYWSDLKKEANTIYKEMELFHKMIAERLDHLFNLNLPVITIEIIESTGIALSKSLFHYTENDISYFYFIDYFVTFNPINKQFKISKHENQLF